jgi:hypothetical protein
LASNWRDSFRSAGHIVGAIEPLRVKTGQSDPRKSFQVIRGYSCLARWLCSSDSAAEGHCAATLRDIVGAQRTKGSKGSKLWQADGNHA